MKPKKCKICREPFTPQRPLQMVCGILCANKYLAKRKEVKEKKDLSEMKKSLLTHKDYQLILEPLINKIVRIIDYGQSCISCKRNGKPQAGHYHSKGSNNSIRFNLHNIHIQDYRCNVELSGNISGYNVGLIDIYGKDYKEYVEIGMVKEYPMIKLSIDELKEKIKIAKEIIKELEVENIYTPLERIKLRNYYNLKLGIYI